MRQAEVNSTTVASNRLSNISLFIMFTHIEQHYLKEKREKWKDLKIMIPQGVVKTRYPVDLLW